MKDTTAENKKQKVNQKSLEFDIKDLLSSYEKLSKNEKVDQNTLNVVIMKGIIKQHDDLEKAEAKINDLERENNTNKCRIESLETWINKQDKAIKDIFDRVEKEKSVDNSEVQILKQKIETLESVQQKDVITNKCDLCDKTFSQNCDFENHMEEHKVEKKFKCNVCGKMFHLEWRLHNHKTNHTEPEAIKHCHYFNNKKVCPYESIGCKFLHTKSAECRYVDCKNSLCQFSHSKVTEVEPESDFEDSDADFNPNENQCHICRKQLLSKDDLLNHMKNQHEAYFQGMMDVAASMTNFDEAD